MTLKLLCEIQFTSDKKDYTKDVFHEIVSCLKLVLKKLTYEQVFERFHFIIQSRALTSSWIIWWVISWNVLVSTSFTAILSSKFWCIYSQCVLKSNFSILLSLDIHQYLEPTLLGNSGLWMKSFSQMCWNLANKAVESATFSANSTSTRSSNCSTKMPCSTSS